MEDDLNTSKIWTTWLNTAQGLTAIARLTHGVMKEAQSDTEAVNNNNNINNNNNDHHHLNHHSGHSIHHRGLNAAFPPSLLTPGQLFPAAFMSPLALHAGSLFHHWAQASPAVQGTVPAKATTERTRTKSVKKEKIVEEPVEVVVTSAPLSPPTSGSSPQSNGSSGHEASVTDRREKVFTCGICNRSFGYKHVLQNHERTHTGEKPFECPQCQKRFTRDHHLKTHMRLHTGEKPYHCTHCDRHFVQVANLRRHLRVHTGERPYACDLCSSRFSDSNQLKAHTLIHKGEKPFHCERCSSRFRRRHHLMHHKCHGKASDAENITTESSSLTNISEETLDDFDEEHHHDADVEIEMEAGDDLPLEPRDTRVRERKSRDIRRVIRYIPEQTEPEDLSLSHKRNEERRMDWHSIRRQIAPTSS